MHPSMDLKPDLENQPALPDAAAPRGHHAFQPRRPSSSLRVLNRPNSIRSDLTHIGVDDFVRQPGRQRIVAAVVPNRLDLSFLTMLLP